MKTYQVELQLIFTYSVKAHDAEEARHVAQYSLARGMSPLLKETVTVVAEELEPGNVPEKPPSSSEDPERGNLPGQARS